MSDENATPDMGTSQPDPSQTAPEAQDTAADPYEARYSDLRSEFDRRNSLLDRARNGDAEALNELGFELYQEQETEPQQPEWDPYDPQVVNQTIAQVVEQRVQEALRPIQEQQRQQEMETASAVKLGNLDGFSDLPESAQNVVWELAKSNRAQDGLYDVEGAYASFNAVRDEILRGHVQGKPVTAIPQGGEAATHVKPNLDASIHELQQWAMEEAAARSSGSY